jgi:hypothetical protein
VERKVEKAKQQKKGFLLWCLKKMDSRRLVSFSVDSENFNGRLIYLTVKLMLTGLKHLLHENLKFETDFF